MKVVSMSALVAAAALSMPGLAHAQTAFDGPSIGVQGGWSQTKTKAPSTDLGTPPIDAKQDAATIAGYVGYDKSFGKIVLGGEAGFGASTDDEVTSADGAITIDPRWSFDVTARAGYLVTPKTLVYLRGGYANESIRTSVAGAGGAVTADENRDGWLVGAGVERAITHNISARLEYRYTDFSEGDGTFDRHQTLLGVTYHF